jgi:DNA-binding GntR family transcriptional regulator
MRNIYEIRELIEPFLIRWFVRHHNNKELAALKATQRSLDECVENDRIDRVHELNVQFHSICYDNHYNSEALAIAHRHNSLISAIVVRLNKSRARVHAMCREHWAIIEAVRQQDVEKAAVVVADHVRNASQHIIERMMAESVIKMKDGYS